MSYIGMWRFHSIGTINEEDEMVYLGAQEYIDSPMPYVDTEDEEAVQDELKERKQMAGSAIEVCEDGKLYLLMALPEGVSEEEVDAAVKEGIISLRGNMIAGESYAWEERDGQLWAELGMSEDGFVPLSEGEFLTMMTMRYAKEQ